MEWTRRGIAAAGASATFLSESAAAAGGGASPYGLISQIMAVPGQRTTLASVLIAGARGMPGCLSYIVAADDEKDDALWITEIWTDKASHANALRLATVQAAIAKAQPLIVGFSNRAETRPIGGVSGGKEP